MPGYVHAASHVHAALPLGAEAVPGLVTSSSGGTNMGLRSGLRGWRQLQGISQVLDTPYELNLRCLSFLGEMSGT